jgi:hypothetical protein
MQHDRFSLCNCVCKRCGRSFWSEDYTMKLCAVCIANDSRKQAEAKRKKKEKTGQLKLWGN